MLYFVVVIILLLNVDRSTYNILTIKLKYYYSREKKINFKHKVLFFEFSRLVGGFGGSFVEKEDLKVKKCFLPLSFYLGNLNCYYLYSFRKGYWLPC